MYQSSPASLFATAAREVKPDFVLSILLSTFDGKTGEVIAIEWGEQGYHKTNLGRQTKEWVDERNADAGIDPATAMAYSTCSLFGRWANYETVLEHMQQALNKKEANHVG
jgi:hypothetical protein